MKIGGSPVGARAVYGDQVDALRGVETEIIDGQEVREMELVNRLTSDAAVKTDDTAIETDVLAGMADSPSEVEGDMLAHVSLPGYLPNNNGGPPPFTTKQVENILQAVITTYKRYPTDKEFRVSGIVLEFQQAMSYDKSTHSKSQNQNGVQLAIPVQNVMIKDPKH